MLLTHVRLWSWLTFFIISVTIISNVLRWVCSVVENVLFVECSVYRVYRVSSVFCVAEGNMLCQETDGGDIEDLALPNHLHTTLHYHFIFRRTLWRAQCLQVYLKQFIQSMMSISSLKLICWYENNFCFWKITFNQWIINSCLIWFRKCRSWGGRWCWWRWWWWSWGE